MVTAHERAARTHGGAWRLRWWAMAATAQRRLPSLCGNDIVAGMAAKGKKPTRSRASSPASARKPATEKDVRVRVFEGHEDSVWCVAMPADGRFALTSSKDGTVRRWALGEGDAKSEIGTGSLVPRKPSGIRPTYMVVGSGPDEQIVPPYNKYNPTRKKSGGVNPQTPYPIAIPNERD